ncbi:MAG TPA: LuxR C-terminal-related transcriptional regulator [Acidimicrobiales bacterium]|nr:LuxR C-terminal-related transcriptional regulator [Acidimicrobiales bacterium]
MPGGRALIGRSAELALTESCLQGIPRRAVVIGGHAGVGKTRLAREIGERWSGRAAWVSGAASTSGIPGAAILRFLSGSIPEPAPGTTADAALIVAAVTEALQQPDRLVIVDDLHALDHLSALFVQQLVLDGTVPVAMTVRSGEAAPAVLRMLWEDGLAERVDLLPLSELETAELAATQLGGRLAAGTGGALFAASQGNPLLLRELIHDASDAGTLRCVEDVWRWDGRLGRAQRLHDTITARLDALGTEGRELVTLLAIGQPLGLALLRGLVTGVDLDDAERRGLLEVRQDRLRVEAHLGHPLLGEVLLPTLAAEELDRTRHALAAAIEASGARRRGDLLLVAKLRLDAGDRPRDTSFALAAGRALELGAGDLGTELAGAAVAADPNSAEARLVLAEANLLGGREAAALAHLDAAVGLATSDLQRMRAAQGLQQAYRLLEQPEQVRTTLDRIRRDVRDPVWRAVIDCLESQQCMFEGRSRLGVEIGERLLAAHDDPRVHLRLVSTVGVGRILHGQTGRGLELVEAMLPVALELQHELPLGPSWVMNAYGLGLMLSGRLDDAVAFIELVRDLTVTEHVSLVSASTPMLTAFAGRIELARGHAAAAFEMLDEACAQLGPNSVSGLSRWVYSLRAEARALSGQVDEARHLLREADLARSTMLLYEGDACRARAWVVALGGELRRAIDDLDGLAALQELEGQHALEAVTLHHAVRLGAGSDLRARLATAVARTDGQLADAYRLHLDALEQGDGDALEAAAERFAGLGMRLEAAETYAAAARAHERAGLRARVAAAVRHSDEHHAATGAIRTPALQERLTRAQLTVREREIVVLAARGLSNREIADQLYISLRTAEGHLYRACSKLGIGDRTQLAEVVDGYRDTNA